MKCCPWFGGSGLLTARALLRVSVRFRYCIVTRRRSTAETDRVIGTVGAGTAELVAVQVSEFRDISSDRPKSDGTHFYAVFEMAKRTVKTHYDFAVGNRY